MNKQKVGLAVFWTSVIWMIAWVVAAKIFWNPLLRSPIMEEIN